ncbi:MAG: alginate export family protein, partial [Candidatus Omnitrophica bacterium]|nr:alginate export family protein [Candidatus Omnitrophota bacterium]
ATDMLMKLWEGSSIQPYVGMLLDYSVGKRLNFFQTPVRRDSLGTVGISWDFTLGKFSGSLEWARNFGGANSTDQDFPDVEHRGWAAYADALYDAGKLTPYTRFIYASGNKLTTDMIANGDSLYTSGKNNAFSVYSPLNANLAGSIYPGIQTLPLVAMGNGYGMNYGVPRPTTFNDPGIIENLILVNAGFSYDFTDKCSATIEWWYLASAQNGIGLYNGVPKVISPELGHEVDIDITYSPNSNIMLELYSGIFFPGAAYREERTDRAGSLFTPFVRGDGKADTAYQVEISLAFIF